MEMTQIGLSILEQYHLEERENRLTQEEAKENALHMIRNLRYGEESLDYYWIIDLDNVVLVNPYKEEHEGQNMSQERDPDGVYFIAEFVNKASQEGSGYVNYRWQYYDDTNRIEPKIAYVTHFEPWGWVIGTAVYLNDIELMVSQKEKDTLFFVSIVIIGSLVVSLIFSKIVFINPLETLVMHAQKISEGNFLSKSKIKSADEIGYLAQVMDKMAVDLGQAVDRISKQKQLFEALYSNTTDAVIYFDDKLNIKDINKQVSKLFGYELSEIKDKNINTILNSNEEIKYNTKSVKFESNIKAKNNKLISVLITIVPVDLNKKNTSSFAIFTDISERKKAEEKLQASYEELEAAYEELTASEEEIKAQFDELQSITELLKESEERWQFALEGFGDGVFDYNIKENKGYYSTKWKEFLGFDDSNFLNFEDWLERVHPEDRGILARNEEVLSSGQESETLQEFRIKCRTGEYIWVLCRSKVMAWDKDGNPTRILQTHSDISRRKKFEEILNMTQFAVDNSSNAIFWLNEPGEFVYVNHAASKSLKYSREKLLNMTVFDIDTALDSNGWKKHWEEVKKQGNLRIERIHKNSQGEEYPVEIFANFFEYSGKEYIFSYVTDISARKRAEKEIKLQKKSYEVLFRHSADGIALADNEGRVIEINEKFTEIFGYTNEEAKGKTTYELLFKEGESHEEYMEIFKSLLEGKTYETEVIRYSKDGSKINILLRVIPVIIDGVTIGNYGIYTDISERKKYEEKLRYLSLHDSLTGLYNRNYFEEELKRLENSRLYPITLISADLDGLKLINDTIGHKKGDELLKNTAKILEKSVRKSDVVARIGGDEFVVILPKTPEDVGEKVVERIKSAINDYNAQKSHLPLSLSIGLATTESPEQTLEETLKMADDLMYRDKLYHRTSSRNKIVESLLAALAERDRIADGHAARLLDLCQKLGKKAGLSTKQQIDLALLAQVHDLGKVGIPDNILFKPGPLTEKEWEVMRLHPEKGYRIAQSAPDLSGIAELILKHHERWDGKGYPLGLKGEDIPVECRILAIADSFDALVNDRPYKKGLTKEEALEEIKKYAGTQFDPNLVDMFLELFKEEN